MNDETPLPPFEDMTSCPNGCGALSLYAPGIKRCTRCNYTRVHDNRDDFKGGGAYPEAGR